jgi:hypothetical protein
MVASMALSNATPTVYEHPLRKPISAASRRGVAIYVKKSFILEKNMFWFLFVKNAHEKTRT